MKIFVRNHKIWGRLAVLAMLVHAGLQFLQYGFVWSGFLTACALFVQGILGVSLKKHPNKKILHIHKYIAIFLVIFLGMHLIHTEYFL